VASISGCPGQSLIRPVLGFGVLIVGKRVGFLVGLKGVARVNARHAMRRKVLVICKFKQKKKCSSLSVVVEKLCCFFLQCYLNCTKCVEIPILFLFWLMNFKGRISALEKGLKLKALYNDMEREKNEIEREKILLFERIIDAIRTKTGNINDHYLFFS
jgi:hypothetical protein